MTAEIRCPACATKFKVHVAPSEPKRTSKARKPVPLTKTRSRTEVGVPSPRQREIEAVEDHDRGERILVALRNRKGWTTHAELNHLLGYPTWPVLGAAMDLVDRGLVRHSLATNKKHLWMLADRETTEAAEEQMRLGGTS